MNMTYKGKGLKDISNRSSTFYFRPSGFYTTETVSVYSSRIEIGLDGGL